MKIVIDGQEVSIPPQGPAGPDGNPIGTIISFMGTSAPKDYLVCDGAGYSISQYPALAAFFQTQFGTKNHFGGDGEATFAVPDLRNLFLRGYHGEAEEVSGDLGARQEATEIPWVAALNGYCTNGLCNTGISKDPNRPDDLPHFRNNELQYFDSDSTITSSVVGGPNNVFQNNPNTEWEIDPRPVPVRGKVRPVNMAVLYCIKAVESVPAENVYSTGETRIGTWLDKPLYRRAFSINVRIGPESSKYLDGTELYNADKITHIVASVIPSWEPVVTIGGNNYISCGYSKEEKKIRIYSSAGSGLGAIQVVSVFAEYTKTTD